MLSDALMQVEMSYPKEMAWKVYMYRGFLAICHPEEHHLNLIERLVDMASSQAIKEWKRIPRIVSHIHTPLLQAAQQIIELQEAAQVLSHLLLRHDRHLRIKLRISAPISCTTGFAWAP